MLLLSSELNRNENSFCRRGSISRIISQCLPAAVAEVSMSKILIIYEERSLSLHQWLCNLSTAKHKQTRNNLPKIYLTQNSYGRTKCEWQYGIISRSLNHSSCFRSLLEKIWSIFCRGFALFCVESGNIRHLAGFLVNVTTVRRLTQRMSMTWDLVS